MQEPKLEAIQSLGLSTQAQYYQLAHEVDNCEDVKKLQVMIKNQILIHMQFQKFMRETLANQTKSLSAVAEEIMIEQQRQRDNKDK